MLLVQPYFAVACGIGFAWFAALARRIPAGQTLAMLAAVGLVALCLGDARAHARAAVVRPPTLTDQVALANLVNVYRDHRGSVWVVGAAHLLGLEHADNHVPHAYLAGPITREIDFSTYRPLRDGKMPEVVVISRGIIPGGRGWLRAEYEEITPLAFAAQRIRVFGRRQPGISGPAPAALPGARKPPVKPAAVRPAPPAGAPPRPPAKPAGTLAPASPQAPAGSAAQAGPPGA
jgi:hypothetical protein